MSGYGLSTLTAGDNIYFATGNTHHGTYAAPANLSESVVKLAPDLSAIQGYFTDPQQVQEDTSDLDLGSGGVMVLPTMPGINPRLLIAAGKLGNMYLLAANNMKLLATYPIGPCWCGPSFYQGADGVFRVVSSGGQNVMIWDLATSNSSPATLTKERAITITSGPDLGFFTSVSSNGPQPGTAIIWAVGRPTAIPGAPTLYAIDPTTGVILLQTPAGNWTVGSSNANIVPTVANGHVYVGSNTELQIFCLPGAAMAAAVAKPSTAGERATAAAAPTREAGRARRHRLDQANRAGLADHRNPHRTARAGR